MRHVRNTVYLIALGATLVAYAHTTFTTKDTSEKIYDMVKETRDMVNELYIRKIKE